MTALPMVDLPAPDSPTTPTICALSAEKERSLTAAQAPRSWEGYSIRKFFDFKQGHGYRKWAGLRGTSVPNNSSVNQPQMLVVPWYCSRAVACVINAQSMRQPNQRSGRVLRLHIFGHWRITR